MPAWFAHIPFPVKLMLAGLAMLLTLSVLPHVAGWLGVGALVLWSVALAALLQAGGLLPGFLDRTVVGRLARACTGSAGHGSSPGSSRSSAPSAVGASGAAPVTAPASRCDAVERAEAALSALRRNDAAIGRIVEDIVPRAKACQKEKRRLLRAARGLVVLVSGPPGVGKSSVARALADLFYGLDVVATSKIVEIDASAAVRFDQDWRGDLRDGLDGIVMVDNAGWLAEGEAADAFFRAAVDVGERAQGRLLVLVTISDAALAQVAARTGLAEAERRLTIRQIRLGAQPPDTLVSILAEGLAARGLALPDDLTRKARSLVAAMADHQGDRFDHAEAMRRTVEALEDRLAASARHMVTAGDLDAALDAD